MLLLTDIREPDVDISNGKNKRKKNQVEKNGNRKKEKTKMQGI